MGGRLGCGRLGMRWAGYVRLSWGRLLGYDRFGWVRLGVGGLGQVSYRFVEVG